MERPVIDQKLCTGCEICINECPNDCLEMVDDVANLVRPEDCSGCAICEGACPSEAITMK